MTAGAYVGRVGGLAVALGIGAAIVSGTAIAAADEGTGAGTTASSPSAPSSSASAGPSTANTDTNGAADPGADGDEDDQGDAGGGHDEVQLDGTDEDGTGQDGTEEEEPEEGRDEVVDDQIPGRDADAPGSGVQEPEVPAPLPEPVADAVSEDTLAEEPPADDEPPAPETVAPQPPDVESPVVADPVVADSPVTPVQNPAAAVTAELPAPAATDSADGSDEPTVPALATLVMSLVNAGRQATDSEPSVSDTATTNIVAAAPQTYPIPTDVTVTEVVAPLQWLQDIPAVGEFLVTPVVSFIHRIPLVGEFLHPYIGWPVDHHAPPGAPQPRDVKLTSFDGRVIYVHFMPARGLRAGHDAPTVLNGPGLGLPGSTALDVWADTLLPNDVIGVGALRDAGYNVVTWDPRGEWRSEGIMHLNSPDLEGRDVSAIISWVASLPEVKLDEKNDPRIGMVGASYGGGIQLATAAIDHRIDAIVPTIAWNNLVDVLFPRGAVNSSWGTLLPSVLVLTSAREHPRILPVAIMGVLFGIAQQSDIDLVTELGYQDQIRNITAPTLLIQGTVDTLFPLSQADAVAGSLINAEAMKVVWYCGGHGTCLSDYNDGRVVIDRTLDWLDHYVKGDGSVGTGPQFEWVDQNGDWHSAPTYPAQPEPDSTPIVASSTKHTTLPFIPFLFGSGPNPLILTRGPIAALLGLPSPTEAINAANLHVPDATTLTHVVGAPQLTLTYSGTGNAKHVYAQIVDDKTGLVLGNQVTPIPVVLDGATQTVTISLEQVAHTLQPGQSVTVQIVTSAVKFLNFYQYGAITVEGMRIELPTLEDTAASQVPIAV
jgi:ABC-2 type transport system ATP-binding protein